MGPSTLNVLGSPHQFAACLSFAAWFAVRSPTGVARYRVPAQFTVGASSRLARGHSDSCTQFVLSTLQIVSRDSTPCHHFHTWSFHLLQRPALQSRPPTARPTSCGPPLLLLLPAAWRAPGRLGKLLLYSTPPTVRARGSRVLRPRVHASHHARTNSSLWEGENHLRGVYPVHFLSPPSSSSPRLTKVPSATSADLL